MFHKCKNLIPLLNELDKKRIRKEATIVRMSESGFVIKNKRSIEQKLSGVPEWSPVPKWLQSSLRKLEFRERRFIDKVVSRRLATFNTEHQKKLEREIELLEDTFFWKWGYKINQQF